MANIRLCLDDRTCRNESLIEDLQAGLVLAVAALRQYAAGRTWRHIAIDALEELADLGLLEEGEE